MARTRRPCWTPSPPSSRRRPARRSPSRRPWGTAEQRWNLAMSTGDLPDIGDMFYLPSRIVQGRGEWGPLDLTRPGRGRSRSATGNRIVQAVATSRPSTARCTASRGASISAAGTPAPTSVPRSRRRSRTWRPRVRGRARRSQASRARPSSSRGTDNLNMAGLAYGTTILTPDYTASNLLDPKWIEAATVDA